MVPCNKLLRLSSLLLVFCACCLRSSWCFSVLIQPGEQECFILSVSKGSTLNGNFEVLEDSNPVGIDCKVVGPTPKHEVMYSTELEIEAIFSFEAVEDGDHTMCLANNNEDDSRGQGILVGFAFRLIDDASIRNAAEGDSTTGAGGPADSAKPLTARSIADKIGEVVAAAGNSLTQQAQAAPVVPKHRPAPREGGMMDLIQLSNQIAEGVAALEDHQKYMRQREERHRDMTENTNTRILWWTVVEVAILVMMALWQITYIRKFFEVKRFV